MGRNKMLVSSLVDEVVYNGKILQVKCVQGR